MLATRTPKLKIKFVMIEIIELLARALKESQDHLEYCGYGDAWERECAEESGLEETINHALVVADLALQKEGRKTIFKKEDRETSPLKQIYELVDKYRNERSDP